MIDLPSKIKADNKKKILNTAEQMINGDLNLIKGSRMISNLRGSLDEVDSSVFDVFNVVSSDTETIPIDDDVRKNYGDEYLKQSDLEMKNYIEEMRNTIISACRKLKQQYSKS